MFLRSQTLYQNCSNRSPPLDKISTRAKTRKTFKQLLFLNQCHDGESHDLNYRVHGISCRYSNKTSKQNLSHFSLYPTNFHKTKRAYLLIIRSKCSSQNDSTVCSSFHTSPNNYCFQYFDFARTSAENYYTL